MTEISVVSNNFEFGFREFYNLKGDRNCHRSVQNKNDHLESFISIQECI